MNNNNSPVLISDKITPKEFLFSKLAISFYAIILLFVLGEVILPGFISFSHVMSVLGFRFFWVVALGQTLVVLSGNEGIDYRLAQSSLLVLFYQLFLNGQNINIPKALFYLRSG